MISHSMLCNLYRGQVSEWKTASAIMYEMPSLVWSTNTASFTHNFFIYKKVSPSRSLFFSASIINKENRLLKYMSNTYKLENVLASVHRSSICKTHWIFATVVMVLFQSLVTCFLVLCTLNSHWTETTISVLTTCFLSILKVCQSLELAKYKGNSISWYISHNFMLAKLILVLV